MQVYAIKEQIQAYRELQEMTSVNGVPSDVLSKIEQNAASEWQGDYKMQIYTIKEQVKAYLSMH